MSVLPISASWLVVFLRESGFVFARGGGEASLHAHLAELAVERLGEFLQAGRQFVLRDLAVAVAVELAGRARWRWWCCFPMNCRRERDSADAGRLLDGLQLWPMPGERLRPTSCWRWRRWLVASEYKEAMLLVLMAICPWCAPAEKLRETGWHVRAVPRRVTGLFAIYRPCERKTRLNALMRVNCVKSA